jgi:predicted GIY-YIG superfamily endonuclease
VGVFFNKDIYCDMKELIRHIIREHLLEQRTIWTKEMVQNIAKNYEKQGEFIKNEKRAYEAAQRNGWLEEVTSHMKKNIVWTKEMVQNIAKDVSSRGELKQKNSEAYSAALRNGWLEDILGKGRASPTKWTEEILQGIVNNHETRRDLKKGNERAYNYLLSTGLIDNFYGPSERNPSGYWTKEKAHEEALKYTNRRDFRLGSPKAVSVAVTNGWWDEITSHMESLGSLYERAVYAWEFPDNHVYVGLTDDLARREKEHLDPEGRTKVSEHIIKTGLTPIIKKISEYTNVKEAQELERCSVDLYRNTGWIILNKAKTGGLGACKRIWTKERVAEEAKRYETKISFKKGSHSAYVIAVRNGWMDEISQHMIPVDRTIWTYEKTKEFAKQFNSRNEMNRANTSAYNKARKEGWLDEFFPNKYKNQFDKKG